MIKINKISLKELFFNKTMIIAYIFLGFAIVGFWEVVCERYFSGAINSFDLGLNIGNKDIALSIKEAIFGDGGEVKREAPWSLYIVNYMYMIYSGSGIIFLVSLGEIFNIKIIKKTAIGFMTLGLCMVVGGLFTIALDLNVLNIYQMFLSPNITSGMWLMLPLYLIYIPFVMFEIYLLMIKDKKWVKKITIFILILSIMLDIIEYYIQAKLFDMNSARHLWTTYPFLTLYFIVSAFLSSGAIMIFYSFLVYKKSLKEEFCNLISLLKKLTLYLIMIIATYEVVAYLFIDKNWAEVILFGNFKYLFYSYALITLTLPFLILFKERINNFSILLASLFVIIGTYIGRIMFVYGGNAYPMSNRFQTGFEKYGEYETIKEFILFIPSQGEIFIVVGSIGVVLALYKICDLLFSISSIEK